MQINSLHIKVFGLLRDRKISIPGKGINFFEGANEAGKSTMMDCIRYVIFGRDSFYDSNFSNYNDMAPGQLSAAIEGVFSDGTSFRLERSGYKKAETVVSFHLDGEASSEKELSRRLSSASLTMYRNIYAISLSELHSMEAIEKSGMEDKLFSEIMGLGNLSLQEAEKSVFEQANAIYKSRGKDQPVPKLVSEWHIENARLSQIRESLQEFESISSEAEVINRQLPELRRQEERLTSEVRLTENCIKGMADYLTLQDARKELAEILDEKLPVNGEKELERSETHLHTLREQLEDKKSRAEKLRQEIEKTEVNSSLLAQKDAIEQMNESLSAVDQSLQALPELRIKAETSREAAGEAMTKLGAEWTAEKLKRFSLTQTMHETLSHFRKELELAENKRAEKSADLKSLKEKVAEQEDEIGLIQEQVPLQSGDIPDMEAVNNEKRKLELLEARFRQQEQVQSSIRFTYALLIVCLLVFATGIALGAVISPLFWILAISGGVGGVLLYFKQIRGVTNDRKQEELMSELKFAAPLTLEKLTDHRHSLDEKQRVALEKSGVKKELEVAREKLRRIAEKLPQLEEAHKKAREESGEKLAEWNRFLTENAFPEGLLPEDARQRLHLMEQVQRMIREAEEARQNHALAVSRVGQFRESLEKAILESGEMALSDKDTELTTNFRRVRDKVTEEVEKERKLRDLKSRFTQIEEEIETMEGRVKSINLSIKKLLDESGAAHTDELREKYQLQKKRTELISIINEKSHNLKRYCGGDDPENELIEYWKAGESNLGEKLKGLREELRMIGERINESLEDLATLQEKKRNLEEAGSVSEIRSEMEAIENRLHEYYQQWLAAKITLEVMRETREKYQKERQPKVITEASGYFQTITGGRYKGLQASMSHEVVAINTEGEPRTHMQLSRGTREQMLFSLRLGLISAYEKTAEPLPIVLDDVLVNFDPARAQAAAKTLENFAASRQVIYFTCQPNQLKFFKSAKVPNW